MPDDITPFTPHRTRRFDHEADEARIRVIEHALANLASRVTSNPFGDGIAVTGGSTTGGGGGGGENPNPTMAHEVLSDTHSDADPSGPPNDGDLIYGAGSLWRGKPIGFEGQVLKSISGFPEWRSFEHGLLSDSHDGTETNAPLRGALIVGNADPVWARLPVGTDGQVLTTDGTDTFWGSIGSAGANVSGVLCAWAKDDISLFTTSGTDANDELFAAWSKGANDRMSIVMPSSGQADYISFTLNGDIGTAGQDLEIELWKDSGSGMVATGMKTTLSGGAGTEDEAYTTTGGPVSFAAGDNLTLYGKRTGSVTARRVQAVLWGKFTA